MKFFYITFAAIFWTSTVHAFDVPTPDGFVTDLAGVLTAAEEQSLEINLQNYRGETSNEIAVLIINSLEGESIADTAVAVGREWGVGSKENDNGIVLLIAIDDRKMFIATGYGLEGAVPDLAAQRIIDADITPHFKNGDYIGGIEAGVAALKAQIGGEYEGTEHGYSASFDHIPPALLLFFAPFGLLIFFMIYQFFVGILITISPSRSWWEGGFLGGMFGFFFGGLIGLIICAFLGGFTDFLASLIFAKSKRYRAFISKHKKKMKKRKGMWFIGGGGGRGGFGGGGGGFSGGSFGGGGAGGSW